MTRITGLVIAFVFSILTPFSILHAESDSRPPLNPFSLTDIDGKAIEFQDYRGTVLLVNFWATWCPPCVEEFPSIQSLKETYKDKNFEVLAINMGQEKADVDRFTDDLETPINFPVLMDQSISVAKSWKVRALPTTVIIDKNGKEVFRLTGDRDWNDQESQMLVESLLKESLNEQ